MPRLMARLFLLLWACTALVATVTAPTVAADGELDFYRGKQIRIVVSTDAGGAYDTYARLLAQIIREHIPGDPTIIVQNMPGAGGIKTANYIYTTAPRDGTVIAATHTGTPFAALTSPDAASFDAEKLSWIGSITGDPYVGYVWHTAPIKTLEDTKTTELILGGTTAGSLGNDLVVVARDILGLKLKLVSGYKGSNDVKLAMERGEVQGTFANAWSSLRTAEPEWLKDGKIRVIVQHGFRKLPDLPDVPRLLDFATNDADRQALVFMLARQQAAKPYFAPPGVPAERLAILRRAFDETVRDPKFVEMATKAGLSLADPMTGDELAALVANVAKTSPAVIQRVNRILAGKR